MSATGRKWKWKNPPTHCIRGHPLAGENLRVTSQGQRVCKACARLRDSKRVRPKVPRTDKLRASTAEQVQQIRYEKQFAVTEWKRAHGCADCGERDPLVLELDHRDPATKDPRLRSNLARIKRSMSLTGLSWPDLACELGKCDVVCANCHRRRTAIQQNWGSWNPLEEVT